MTPLAQEIYRQLVLQLRRDRSSITYHSLAEAVSKRHATHHRSSSFHRALDEVSRRCRSMRLPCIAAIVWRAATRRPGPGYYAVAHPRARTGDARLRAWQREHDAVVRDRGRFPVAL